MEKRGLGEQDQTALRICQNESQASGRGVVYKSRGVRSGLIGGGKLTIVSSQEKLQRSSLEAHLPMPHHI